MEVPVKKTTDRREVEHTADSPSYVPNVDIYESEEGVVLLADLPAVKKDAIHITVEEGVLSLEARVNPDLGDDAVLRYREFEFGDFRRSFQLGAEVDADRLEAELDGGVLKIVIPTSDWAKTKKIEVK